MSLGNLLLQPQRLQRNSGDDAPLEVAQDMLRLFTLVAEDAAEDGPLAGVAPALLQRVQSRLQTRVEAQASGGVASVYAALKAHFQPLFLYFERLVVEVARLEDEPAALIPLVRQILNAVRGVVAAINQAQIKSQLDFALGLMEDELGIGPDFVNQQIGALFDDLAALWQALPAEISPRRRRRRRLALRLLKRLRAQLLHSFTLPRIDTARAAATLYRLLRSAGLKDILAEIHCALSQFDQALAAAESIRDALPLAAGGSVGAALVEPQGAARYCWYASWLLSDVDLPLLGTSDIKNKKAFVNLLRLHSGGTTKAVTVSRFLFAELTETQQREVLAYDGASDPDAALILMLVAHINQFMQAGPIYTRARFDTLPAAPVAQTPVNVPFTFSLREFEKIGTGDLSEDLRELRQEYVQSQCLYLYNRRFLEWVYGKNMISPVCNEFWRYARRKAIGIRRDVLISGDQRYLMCDDIPLYTAAEGVELKWQEAPLFIDKDSGRWPVEGATYYRFTRVPALACDILAQVFYSLEQTARPIWHLATLQPGHEIGTGIISGLDILHALNMIFFGKPVSGYQSLGGWGSWLANDLYGPRGLALFGGSFQGMHTAATAYNSLKFWVTVVLGDYIRLLGQNSMLQTGRDFVLTFFTLLNASPSNSGDSSLPSNPAANHLKQAGIIGPMNSLFAYLLLLNYPRENHSIEIWSAGDIGERRESAFGLWLGGGIGFGVLSGLSGSLVSQFIAWQEDWKLLGVTILEAMGGMVLGYWIFEYFFKEGDTADGTLAASGSYKGYPAKASSPYRLPYTAGDALYMGQGNNGLFSHNEITSIGKNWQVYAFDVGLDHRAMVRAMRDGVVWSFNEGFADNNEDNANSIIIQHTTLVADHDDPFGTGTPVMTFALYWHGAQNGVTNAFGGTPPGQENAGAGSGTAVTRGQSIMEADDTGTSFHSHVHIYVVTGTAAGPGTNSIPLVFEDVDNDAGLMEFLTWYRAGG